ncbi:12181_t:CDS:1, partial [Gigaspora rosea]
IKNKPTPIQQPKNNDRTNDTTTTYTETASTTTFSTTIKSDFDFPKRPKDLLTSEETTTNSTTTIPFSSTSLTKTTFTRTTSELLEPISDSDVSCQICKIKLKQTEIEERLKKHLKNPLSKDFIHNKLQIKKHLTEFDDMKAIFYKLTGVFGFKTINLRRNL